MKIESNFEKCSICLESKSLTYEHIIPESLDGIIQCNTQCEECNKNLGSTIVSTAKKVYSVRLTVNYLKNILPNLFMDVEKGQLYTGINEPGDTSELIFKKGKLRTRTKMNSEGILNIDSKDTSKHIKSILNKEGLSSQEISKSILNFEKTEIDKPIKLSGKYSAIKRKFKDIYQAPGEIDMNERVIVLIAYNYLCFILGSVMFNEKLNFIRDFIKNNTTSKNIEIEQNPYTNDYEPFHRIYYEANDVSITVFILLFGSLNYKVKFFGFTTINQNKILIEDLKNNRILFSESFDEIKKGYYLTNKPIEN